MNRFAVLLSLISIFICASDCVDFCDVQTMDNVFSVGHLIYITRCGEVWTFDPTMRKGRGAFYKDYSWFVFARSNFGMDVAKQKGEYQDKWFRFAAFSFYGMECDDPLFDIERDCQHSANEWNSLCVIASNYTAVTFRFDNEIIWRNDSNNPFGFPAIQDLNGKRHAFWPDLKRLAPEYDFKEKAWIHSGLFDRENYRLYMGLISSDNLYHCITHMNMKQFMFDIRKWPKHGGDGVFYKWAPPYCFTGSLVGMFSKDNQVYVVGRILYNSREYEDQVYTMSASDNYKVDIEEVNIPGFEHPHNLRTFFGCDVPDAFRTNVKISTEAPRPFVHPVLGPLHPGTNRSNIKKRSIEDEIPFLELIWSDVVTELKEDWILLSLMSVTALFMLFIVFKLNKN